MAQSIINMRTDALTYMIVSDSNHPGKAVIRICEDNTTLFEFKVNLKIWTAMDSFVRESIAKYEGK